MILNCPSCGVVHDTSENPNAFEINCVCGYSILVPSEPVVADAVAPSFERAAPSALDAEDDAVIIRPEGLLAMNPTEEASGGDAPGVLSMTPSEQLPPGMVYDSFELPDAAPARGDQLDLGNSDVFEEASPELQTPEGEARSEAAATADADAAKSGKSGAAARPAPVSKAKTVVQRVQMSSMGQFLGKDYRLTLAAPSVEQAEHLLTLVNRMLRERPWLDAECRRRGLDFKRDLAAGRIEPVPELIALEIYLQSFELGVACQFETIA